MTDEIGIRYHNGRYWNEKESEQPPEFLLSRVHYPIKIRKSWKLENKNIKNKITPMIIKVLISK